MVHGPTADAWTSLASTPEMDMAARFGDLRSTVTTVRGTADSTVTVVLRWIRIGELHIDSITLTAAALADGKAGQAAATTVVEGARLGGQAVRLTPKGFEPLAVGTPDASPLQRAGIELVSAGGTAASPGGRQSDARALGPRIRFTSPDGRLLTVLLGEAVATASREPARG
jgi:hypothetical protein